MTIQNLPMVPSSIQENMEQTKEFYKMWYAGSDGTNYRIIYCASEDGIIWVKQAMILDHGGTGDDDQTHVYSPFILKDDSIYKMWYSGIKPSGRWQMMYATSKDGITWTKYSTTNIIPYGGTGDDDENGLFTPCVIKDGATYKMWYSGKRSSDSKWQIMYATSSNGISWTKVDTVVDVGGTGEDDESSAFYPIVHKSDKTVTAKSVIFDIADYYRVLDYMEVRSIEFKLNGSTIDAGGTVGITAYSTSQFSASFPPSKAFDVSEDKDGSRAYHSWVSESVDSGSSITPPQRLICVFDAPQTFDEIVINNAHSLGTETNTGIKSTKIYISSSAITNTIFNNPIVNSTLLFNGEIPQHVSVDAADDRTIVGDYQMWYSGNDGTDFRLMYAVSPDGINWSKIQTLMDTGLTGHNDEHGIVQVSIIKESATSYKMWYCGYYNADYQIMYAISPDGINWTKHSPTAIIPLGPTGSYDDDQVIGPYVLKENSRSIPKIPVVYSGNKELMKMWYRGYKNSDSKWRIMYATSLDGLTWTKIGTIIDIGLDGSDDGNGTNAPFIIKDLNGYEMWYSGKRTSDSKIQIMYATSSDGVNWVKHGLINFTNIKNIVNGTHVPCVIKDGAIYKMWFSFYNSDSKWQIMYATSSDGFNWINYPDITLLKFGESGEDDENQIQSSRVIKESETDYRMWYGGQAVSGTIWRIMYATSPDGINWTKQGTVLPLGSETDENSHIVAPVVLKDKKSYKQYTAKAVVFDFPDSQSGSALVVRSIEFYNKGILLDVNGTVGVTITYSSQTWAALNAFDVTKSKVGASSTNSWSATSVTNERLICTFTVPQEFDEIVMNNSHNSGASTTNGFKNVQIIITESTGAISTTYGTAVTGGEVIFDDEVLPHISYNVADDQIVVGKRYTMYYTSYGTVGTYYKIKRAVSADGIRWGRTGLLVDKGTSGDDDDVHVYCSFVEHNDKEPVIPEIVYSGNEAPASFDEYQIWSVAGDTVSGSKSIVHNTSQDGVNLPKQGIVLSPSGDDLEESEVRYPFVIKESETSYKMWYSGIDTNPTRRIMYATSTDGVNWVKHGLILDLGTVDDDTHVTYPFVIKESATSYKMWYSGYDGTHYRLMYATSVNGIAWKKYSTAAIMPLGTTGADDDYSIYTGTIIKESDTSYKLWYTGFDAVDFHFMYATSTDGISWTKVQTVMDEGVGGDDDTLIFGCFVLKEGSLYKMWYRGKDGGGDSYILYATSPDGINWTRVQTVLDQASNENIIADICVINSILDIPVVETHTAKSIVIEVADVWGASFLGVRSIEFKLRGELVEITSGDISAHNESSVLGGGTHPIELAFQTDLSKTGQDDPCWHTASGDTTNQWAYIVLDDPIEFDEIIINNHHDSGGDLTKGIKNTKIHITLDTVSSHSYGSVISNGQLIFSGVVRQHRAFDKADDNSVLYVGAPKKLNSWDPTINSSIDHSFNDREISIGSAGWQTTHGHISRSTGKYYFEMQVIAGTSARMGIGTKDASKTNYIGSDAYGWGYGSALALGDIFMCAVDLGTGKVWFGSNGTWFSSGNPALDLNESALDTDITDYPIFPYGGMNVSGDAIESRFNRSEMLYGPPAGYLAWDDEALPTYKAKSLICEMWTNHGDGTYMTCRSIEFRLRGELISLAATDFEAVASTDNGTTISNLFNTSLSKTGADTNGWKSASGETENQWAIISFYNAIEFDQIVINNGHNSGGSATCGVQDFKFYISPYKKTTHILGDIQSYESFISVGAAIQHVSSDIIHNEYLILDEEPGVLLDIVSYDSNITISNNYKTATKTGSSWDHVLSRPYKTSGKWYWEITIPNAITNIMVGFADINCSNLYVGGSTNNDGWGYYSNNGRRWHDGIDVIGYASYTNGVIGIALNMDDGLAFITDSSGNWQNSQNPVTGSNPAWDDDIIGLAICPSIDMYTSGEIATINGGLEPFIYTVPSGYTAFDL